MSINTADVIASAITKRLLVVVTDAPYAAVTGVSGSLQNPHPGDQGWPRGIPVL